MFASREPEATSLDPEDITRETVGRIDTVRNRFVPFLMLPKITGFRLSILDPVIPYQQKRDMGSFESEGR